MDVVTGLRPPSLAGAVRGLVRATGSIGSMDITETARRLMGPKIFTAAELLAEMPEQDRPAGVTYSIQNGGNGLHSLGMSLHHAKGVERVGISQKGGALWRVESVPNVQVAREPA